MLITIFCIHKIRKETPAELNSLPLKPSNINNIGWIWYNFFFTNISFMWFLTSNLIQPNMPLISSFSQFCNVSANLSPVNYFQLYGFNRLLIKQVMDSPSQQLIQSGFSLSITHYRFFCSQKSYQLPKMDVFSPNICKK